MSGTTRIPAAEITGVKGWIIKRFATRTLGTVPTSIGVYCHHQQVLMDMASAGRKLQKWHRCDQQLKSFAHWRWPRRWAARGASTSTTSRPTTKASK